MTELKRSLSVWGATSIGIGAIIDAGIFVISGVASGFAGPVVILSFMIAGIVSFLTALSSAELSSFITEAGGSYIYTDKQSARRAQSYSPGTLHSSRVIFPSLTRKWH